MVPQPAPEPLKQYVSCLMVDNIPSHIYIQDLWEIFVRFGPVSNIQMSSSDLSAVVTFDKPCINVDLLDRPLMVSPQLSLTLRYYEAPFPGMEALDHIYKKKRPLEMVKILEKERDEVSLNNLHRKMFIRKLPSDLTDEEFNSFFANFGKLISSNIVIDQKTGKSRGYGFLSFHNSESVKRVIQNNGSLYLKGQLIDCSIADQKHQPLQLLENQQSISQLRNQSNYMVRPVGGNTIIKLERSKMDSATEKLNKVKKINLKQFSSPKLKTIYLNQDSSQDYLNQSSHVVTNYQYVSYEKTQKSDLGARNKKMDSKSLSNLQYNPCNFQKVEIHFCLKQLFDAYPISNYMGTNSDYNNGNKGKQSYNTRGKSKRKSAFSENLQVRIMTDHKLGNQQFEDRHRSGNQSRMEENIQNNFKSTKRLSQQINYDRNALFISKNGQEISDQQFFQRVEEGYFHDRYQENKGIQDQEQMEHWVYKMEADSLHNIPSFPSHIDNYNQVIGKNRSSGSSSLNLYSTKRPCYNANLYKDSLTCKQRNRLQASNPKDINFKEYSENEYSQGYYPFGEYVLNISVSLDKRKHQN